MASSDGEREILRRAREHLDEWTYEARDRAYGELFEGPDAALTDGELRELDRIDSDLTRRGQTGIWGADEYGIVHDGGPAPGEPGVVCTYHPEIPYEGFRGGESLDEPDREQYNDVLWSYAERVAELVQDQLDEFVRSDGG